MRCRFFSFAIALSVIATAMAASAADEGFVPLFDGKSLKGWKGDTEGYVVQDGSIVCLPDKGGFLYTEKEYSDFVLRLQFKLTPGANNGLGIRSLMGVNPAYEGIEIQILDNTAEQYKDLQPWQYHGSIYGVVAAERGHLKPVGQWNQQEVICDGNRIVVKLNGETIVDADIEEASAGGTIDGKEHPGLKRKSGYIAFCGHGSRVDFRNIELKDLSQDR